MRVRFVDLWMRSQSGVIEFDEFFQYTGQPRTLLRVHDNIYRRLIGEYRVTLLHHGHLFQLETDKSNSHSAFGSCACSVSLISHRWT